MKRIEELIKDFEDFYEKNRHRTVTEDEIQSFWDCWYLEWENSLLNNREYQKLITLSHDSFPAQINGNWSLKKRIDRRSLAQVALDFATSARQENNLVTFLFDNYAEKFWPDYESHEHHADGRLLFSDPDRFKSVDIDITLKDGTTTKDDLKVNNYDDNKGTFKDANLKNYLGQNASMTIFNMDEDGTPKSLYHMTPEAIQGVWDNCKSIQRHEFGGKSGKQIHFIDDPELLQEYESTYWWNKRYDIPAFKLKDAIHANEFGIERIDCKERYSTWRSGNRRIGTGNG